MLFADLIMDNTTIFLGQTCRGNMALGGATYLNLPGIFMFLDTQGFDDPVWEGLGTRFQLNYLSPGSPAQIIPLQTTPIQNLVAQLDTHGFSIAVYEQPIPTDPFYADLLPIDADEGYKMQYFLAIPSPYVVDGYWVTTYAS